MADKWRIIEAQPFRRQPFVLLGLTACSQNNKKQSSENGTLCVVSKCVAVSMCEQNLHVKLPFSAKLFYICKDLKLYL